MSKDLAILIDNISKTPSDINEHIPTLIKYGKQCSHITEMGVRWVVSTWAFLSTFPKNLKSYDMQNPSTWGVDIQDVYDTAKLYNVNFLFTQANVLDIEIEQTDLLFIDTWHAYKQLKNELKLHSSKVNKYIIFHDTTTFADKDETSYEFLGSEWIGDQRGIWLAIQEFLQDNTQWQLLERFHNNNGLTVIGKNC